MVKSDAQKYGEAMSCSQCSPFEWGEPLIDMSAGAGLREGRHAHDSLCYVYRAFEEI